MEPATTFFSLLTLLANAGVALWLVAALGGRRRSGLRASLEATVSPIAIPLALLVAAVALGGSLYYSESVGLIPCDLCWYQRIAAYPLVVLFAVGWLRRDSAVWSYTFPLVVVGFAFATYNYLIERFPSLEAGWCATTVPCSDAYFVRFAFISLPYMAMSVFAAIGTLWWIVRSTATSEVDIDSVSAPLP